MAEIELVLQSLIVSISMNLCCVIMLSKWTYVAT